MLRRILPCGVCFIGKLKELTYIDVAGCTPEERLDMSMIAVELGNGARHDRQHPETTAERQGYAQRSEGNRPLHRRR
jgi:hypothetical protein